MDQYEINFLKRVNLIKKGIKNKIKKAPKISTILRNAVKAGYIGGLWISLDSNDEVEFVRHREDFIQECIFNMFGYTLNDIFITVNGNSIYITLPIISHNWFPLYQITDMPKNNIPKEIYDIDDSNFNKSSLIELLDNNFQKLKNKIFMVSMMDLIKSLNTNINKVLDISLQQGYPGFVFLEMKHPVWWEKHQKFLNYLVARLRKKYNLMVTFDLSGSIGMYYSGYPSVSVQLDKPLLYKPETPLDNLTDIIPDKTYVPDVGIVYLPIEKEILCSDTIELINQINLSQTKKMILDEGRKILSKQLDSAPPLKKLLIFCSTYGYSSVIWFHLHPYASTVLDYEGPSLILKKMNQEGVDIEEFDIIKTKKSVIVGITEDDAYTLDNIILSMDLNNLIDKNIDDSLTDPSVDAEYCSNDNILGDIKKYFHEYPIIVDTWTKAINNDIILI